MKGITMSAQLEKIGRKAQRLSREDREQLAADLIAGLDNSPLTEVDQAWIVEAERRYDELSSGRVKGIPAQDVFDSIRRELGWTE
jgi:putative addiction module component (TIGR02574 family)